MQPATRTLPTPRPPPPPTPSLFLVNLRQLPYFANYWNRQTLTNSVDQDQTPQNRGVWSGSTLFALIEQFFVTSTGGNMALFQILA